MEVTNQSEDWNKPTQPQQENKKVLAGVMGILFGGLGVHKFILGYTQEGIIQLVVSCCDMRNRKYNWIYRRNYLLN